MPIVGQKIETTVDNFSRMREMNCLLVDKSLMIKDFIKGQDVSLILRPRRSGKSLNLSMLHYFFASEVANRSTSGLFDDLAIAKEDNGSFLLNYQGKYPVIAISFKDIKQTSYEKTVLAFGSLIEELYRDHKKVLLSDRLDSEDKELFKNYLRGMAEEVQLEKSLFFLSQCLYQVYNKKVIILIDEYDSPLTAAYEYHFLDPLTLFMRNLFSFALKGNRYLEKALITGILRVSKNEMLSGLNNLEVYSLFEREYDQYFGFTEAEVIELMKKVNIESSLNEVKAFYNGYQFGDKIIYNAWSMMHFLAKKRLEPYWVLTSGDKLLRQLFLNSDAELKDQMASLMKGECIIGKISMKMSYEELMEKPDALWTLLLFAGYLTVSSKEQEEDDFVCQLRIPNQEIAAQYKSIFKFWLTESLGGGKYHSFLKSLLLGDVPLFTKSLSDYLMESLSFRDVLGDKKAENFYHGFVAGLIASLGETHFVDSNKESGHGLYDIMITPKKETETRGLIIEFKHAKKTEIIEEAAKVAFNQINALNYQAQLNRYAHIQSVLKIGLAFSGKEVISLYQEQNLKTGFAHALQFSSKLTKEEWDESLSL